MQLDSAIDEWNVTSVVEEALIEEFATLLGLPPPTRGIWASGGRLANLRAMFAAAGGYSETAPPRHEVTIVMGERGHGSVSKASRVLGVPLVSVPAADAASGCFASRCFASGCFERC